MRLAPVSVALLIAACDSGGQAVAENAVTRDARAQPSATRRSSPVARASAAPATLAARWTLHRTGRGAALVLASPAMGTLMRLSCPAGRDQLAVHVPGFRPIGSEERLSLGSGDEVVALVADPRSRGRGVTATGGASTELAELVSGPIAATYGAQTSGPHPAPSRNDARAFVAACGTARVGPRTPGAAATPESGACFRQGSARLPSIRLRGVGTEPFWSAQIEGRCVTYAHPDDQKGTRVWTRYRATADGGLWAGALGGRRFELRTRTAPGCSDGMSDRRYPLAVELRIGGETRRGCAARA